MNLHTSIVDHDIKPLKMVNRLLHKPIDLLILRDIGLHDDCRTATLLNRLAHLLGFGLIMRVVDNHCRPGSGHLDRYRASDPAIRAGDDGNFPLQIYLHSAVFSLLSIILICTKIASHPEITCSTVIIRLNPCASLQARGKYLHEALVFWPYLEYTLCNRQFLIVRQSISVSSSNSHSFHSHQKGMTRMRKALSDGCKRRKCLIPSPH